MTTNKTPTPSAPLPTVHAEYEHDQAHPDTIPTAYAVGYYETVKAYQPTQRQSIPPGARPGGEWLKQKYVGSKTGAAACAGFLLFCLPGLFLLCFPMDKRYVYQEPGRDGRLFDGAGRVIHGGHTPQKLPPGYKGMNV
eukprot:CAMPEP_0183308232 /NCGR_PEP_ID=MMETSP0160_2-20130417/20555_1 /TAXON_ID=2839 ORGANISM="Odontella Sinensis, Strain Grunow 1884" /NCGR_SAMPLE_ID=MMETSP0160_2 /ASSEMBLY_ACC=CAM_ASM_000250 /LENGTH=137 /DNA_ID=CAMNT_0025472021 /DNA_START=81 /DNA_END=494 /DNA_ORIENTATION=+